MPASWKFSFDAGNVSAAIVVALQGEAYLPQAKRQLFVVGIGASAGGIEAFEGLFHYLPPDTGAAFVIVAHLAPNKVSMLDEIVGRFTAMPVAQARDGIKVESDHVYTSSLPMAR